MPMGDYGNTLKHAVMTKVIREFDNQGQHIGATIFKDAPVLSRTATVDVVQKPRHLAPYRHPENKSGKQRGDIVKSVTVALPTIKESTDLTADTLNILRAPGTEHKRWGEAKVAEELASLKQIAENRREWARWQVLTTGALSYTATVGTSRIVIAVDYSMADSHKPALSSTAMWSALTTATPIVDILAWKKIYAQDSGKNARYAFCNDIVMGYLLNNSSVQAVMGDVAKDQALFAGKLKEICGLELIQYDLGYVPIGGSFTGYLGDDDFVLWSGDKFDEIIGIFSDLKARTPGYFAKSFETEDPSGVTVLGGVCPLPSAARINEFFCADVHTTA